MLPFALGSLGFLTNFDFADHRSAMDAVLDGGIRVNLRMRFTCTVYRAVQSHTGGNKKKARGGKLKAVKNADFPYTLILDDPLANSYLQNLYAPDPDPNMTIETYDRTWEQNDDLGLNDMKVEGYEEDVQPKAR